MTDLPEWLEKAAFDVVQSAVAAEVADTAAEGRTWLHDGFQHFAEAVMEHEEEQDAHWFYLAFVLATMAVQADRDFFGEDETAFIEMEDARTGEVIEDPDEELADMPKHKASSGRAILAAMRMIVACGNGDLDTFDAIFETSAENGTAAMALHVLAQCAGRSWIAKMKRDGTLPPELAGNLAAREAEEIVEASARPEPAATRITKEGLAFRSLPVDERDQTDEGRRQAAPHGEAVYAITLYPAGDQKARDQAIAAAHSQMIETSLLGQGTPLCGVQHWETIEAWQVPHSGRTQLNRQLRKVKREHGREFAIVRCWQHLGSCPEVGDSAV